ncbi:MAG: hypothetical protein ACP5HJ_00390 [Candidatus Micrarchaeia archaeon]
MQNPLYNIEINEKYKKFFENLKESYKNLLKEGIKEGREYFLNFDFFSSFGFFVEPLQAFPTVDSYYQYFYINNVKQPTNWAKGITGLFFSKNFIAFIFSRIISSEGEYLFSNFYAIKLKPQIEIREEIIKISFNSKIKVTNVLKKEEEEKSLKFSFVDSTFDKSYLSLREAKNDSLLRKIGKYNTKSFLLNLEMDYTPTKPFFQPYWFINNYKIFGFASRLEFQKNFKEFLKQKLEEYKN